MLMQARAPSALQSPPGQQSEVDLIIGDRIGAQPTFAVPDCLAVDMTSRSRRPHARSPRCCGTIWSSSASSG